MCSLPRPTPATLARITLPRRSGWRKAHERPTARRPGRIKSVGIRRIVEGRCREWHTRIGARQDCVPVPCARPPYGLGPVEERDARSLQGKLNGAAPGADLGSDSGADGTGEVRQPRMYQLVRQKGPIADITFEIEFLDPGVEAFSFHVWVGRRLNGMLLEWSVFAKRTVEMEQKMSDASDVANEYEI